jgi:hypothetical protein
MKERHKSKITNEDHKELAKSILSYTEVSQIPGRSFLVEQYQISRGWPFLGGKATLAVCRSPDPICPLLTSSTLWFVAWFVGYGLVVRNDKATLLRIILHGAGFVYGTDLTLRFATRGLSGSCFFLSTFQCHSGCVWTISI